MGPAADCKTGLFNSQSEKSLKNRDSRRRPDTSLSITAGRATKQIFRPLGLGAWVVGALPAPLQLQSCTAAAAELHCLQPCAGGTASSAASRAGAAG